MEQINNRISELCEIASFLIHFVCDFRKLRTDYEFDNLIISSLNRNISDTDISVLFLAYCTEHIDIKATLKEYCEPIPKGVGKLVKKFFYTRCVAFEDECNVSSSNIKFIIDTIALRY